MIHGILLEVDPLHIHVVDTADLPCKPDEWPRQPFEVIHDVLGRLIHPKDAAESSSSPK